MGLLGGEDYSGRILGGVELRQFLGSGAMGAVYRGYQLNPGRDVAVKVLPRSLAAITGFGARFEKEAKILGRLEHPHIIPIYVSGTQDGISYIVMRYMKGGSLVDRLNESPFSLATTVDLLCGMADALDYAHRSGVIHRDIKPSNVLFDDSGKVYLADFGIAKLLDASETQTTPTNQVGTPMYMAPELWRNEEPTAAADIYALGAVAYMMFVRKAPFEAASPYALMVMHLTQRQVPLNLIDPAIPPAIAEVVDRALEKDLTKRLPTAKAFADALRTALPAASPQSNPAPEPRPGIPVASPSSAPEISDTQPPNAPRLDFEHDELESQQALLPRLLLWTAAIGLLVIGFAVLVTLMPDASLQGSNLLVAALIDTATDTASPTANTPSVTHTVSPTITATLSPTPSDTLTSSATPTRTPTITASATHTMTATVIFETAAAPTATEAVMVSQAATRSSASSSSQITRGSLAGARTSSTVNRNWTMGDVVDICLRSRDFDTVLTLHDADEGELAANDDYGGGTDACIMDFQVPETGLYLIRIGSYGADPSGDYELVETTFEACGDMPIAVVSVAAANLRRTPNSNGGIIETMARNRCFPITGKSSNQAWWQIARHDDSLGWISVATVRVIGDTSEVPIISP